MGSETETGSAALDLKDFFFEKLRERRSSLEVALAGEIHEGSAAEVAIRHIAHGVRGSAGTFGYPELSALAETVDLAPLSELGDRARGLLEALHRVIDAPEDGTGPTRVLVIGGDDDHAPAMLGALGSDGREVQRASTAEGALELLAEQSFQLIVLDLVLPDLDGRSLLVRLREQFQTADVPVIALAANANPALHAECYQLGAVQVFAKPVEGEVLAAAAVGAIERAEQSSRVSTLDPLTGLPNRAGFHEMLQRAVSMCARNNDSLSLAVIDLDRFKAINDVHGHLVGDEVLRRVAGVLSEEARDSDYVARWGGEEFVALFYGSDPEGTTHALERIRAKVRGEVFRTQDGTEFNVTFSAGVAQVPETEPASAIEEADRLLYRAKAAGRDRIVNAETTVTTATANILLAEDDELVAAAVSATLRRHGYRIVHMARPEEALEAIGSQEIALGILDVNMPGMDGFELLAKMRRLPKCHDTPLIMLTGRGQETDVVRGFELGADDYVVKPFSPSELAARVNRLARRR